MRIKAWRNWELRIENWEMRSVCLWGRKRIHMACSHWIKFRGLFFFKFYFILAIFMSSEGQILALLCLKKGLLALHLSFWLWLHVKLALGKLDGLIASPHSIPTKSLFIKLLLVQRVYFVLESLKESVTWWWRSNQKGWFRQLASLIESDKETSYLQFTNNLEVVWILVSKSCNLYILL